MTPEVERKRRELFGKWCDEQGHGRASNRRMLWPAFNAALDSIEIELPDVRTATHIAYFNADVIDAITATGLGLRIK